ncbi:MAG TPA: potassium channel family protein [Nocardioides sp.]
MARLAALRTVLSLSALFGAYFLLPARPPRGGSDAPWLALALCVFGVVVGVQLHSIVKAPHPMIRAVETLTLTVPVFLLIFARSYLSGSLGDPASFSEPLDKTTALYFTVSCFATVGFGDIVAMSNPMRLLVTLQMLLDLVMLGALVKLFASAARRGIADRAQQP